MMGKSRGERVARTNRIRNDNLESIMLDRIRIGDQQTPPIGSSQTDQLQLKNADQVSSRFENPSVRETNFVHYYWKLAAVELHHSRPFQGLREDLFRMERLPQVHIENY